MPEEPNNLEMDNGKYDGPNLLHDKRLLFDSLLQRLGAFPVTSFIGKVLKYLFVDIAPGIPGSHSFTFSPQAKKHIFLTSYLVTFFFCFIVTFVWAYVEGTLYGKSSGRIYFLNDYPNLLFYSLICPLYVGFASLLISIVIGGWHDIRRFENELTGEKKVYQKIPFKVPVLLIFSLGAAFFLTSNYVRDVSSPNISSVYWFIETNQQGDRWLNSLGVYYFMFNFALLVVTVFSLVFFMSAFSAVVEVARALEKPAQNSEFDLKIIRKRLSAFTEVYLLAKCQTACYVVNLYLWGNSPLGETSNLIIAHIMLVLVAVFFIAIPKTRIEINWYKYCRSSPHCEIKPIEDLIEGRAKTVSDLIDSLFISSLIAIPFLSYS